MSIGSSLPFRPSGTASVAFVRLGTAGMSPASAADTPVPPGGRMLIDAGRLVSEASAVLASGTGTVYFTRGDGSVY